MELDWIFFALGLLLLFFPMNDRATGRLRLCEYEDIRYDRGGAAAACRRQLWLWLDPFRAFAGGWLLRNAWVIDAPESGIWNHVPLLVTLPVLALALAAQMHTRRDSDVLFAPVAYGAGLVFALLPPQVAVLVVTLAGVCLMAFRGWWAFFFFGAVATGVFGYLILRVNLWMAGTVALLVEPFMLSLMLKCRLVFPVAIRRRRSVRRSESVPKAEPAIEASARG